jgi:pantothenate kinase
MASCLEPGGPLGLLGPSLLKRVVQLHANHAGGRLMLGLVGPPGCGKSTLASLLEQAIAGSVCVPMDGFHLAQIELQRLGRTARKGAPDTFDAAGYVHLLSRLRQPTPHDTLYAPSFSRQLEEPIAGAIAVAPTVSCVITEGNYLLLPDAPWPNVAPLLDDIWYLDVPDDVRLPRLIARHQAFGRSHAEATAWVQHTDEPNARRIAAARAGAHRSVRFNDSCGQYELAS